MGLCFCTCRGKSTLFPIPHHRDERLAHLQQGIRECPDTTLDAAVVCESAGVIDVVVERLFHQPF